jgi:hypothetical protein
MKFVQAMRRFISNAWLVAAPLIIVFLLIAIPLCLAIVRAIIERLFGPEAAEDFSTFLFGAMMWGGELVLGFAPIGLAIYGIVRLARWLVRKKEP